MPSRRFRSFHRLSWTFVREPRLVLDGRCYWALLRRFVTARGRSIDIIAHKREASNEWVEERAATYIRDAKSWAQCTEQKQRAIDCPFYVYQRLPQFAFRVSNAIFPSTHFDWKIRPLHKIILG